MDNGANSNNRGAYPGGAGEENKKDLQREGAGTGGTPSSPAAKNKDGGQAKTGSAFGKKLGDMKDFISERFSSSKEAKAESANGRKRDKGEDEPVSLGERPAPSFEAAGLKASPAAGQRPQAQKERPAAGKSPNEGGETRIMPAGGAKNGLQADEEDGKTKMISANEKANVPDKSLIPAPPAPAGKKKRHKVKKGKLTKYIFLNIIKAGVCLACLGIIVGCITAVVAVQYVIGETVKGENILSLENLKLNYTSYIYAKNPETGEWEVYQELQGNEHRIWVDYDQIPKHLVQAVVATEDRKFYSHMGVDFPRTIFAAVNEVIPLRDNTFGASSITQQLIKNITGDDEVNYMRKVTEMIRALVLDRNYSKDMIMEAYLNTIGLSERLAGVQAGANAYFNKDVSELTLWECATIAGITQYPSKYSPFRNPEACLKRRNDVIYFMQQVGYITESEAEHAYKQPLGVVDPGQRTEEEKKADATFSYITDEVFEQVVRDLQKQKGMTRSEAINKIYTGGFHIYTTVNLELQEYLEDMFYNGYNEDGYFFTNFAQYGDYKGRLTITEDILNEAGNKIGTREVLPQMAVTILNYDGSLAACIGGIGEKEGKLGLNRATQSPRQIGSTIKPIGPYGLAMDYGIITYSTGLLDAPVMPSNPNNPRRDPETGAVINDWPHNVYTGYKNYTVPAVSALSESINTCAVRVGEMVGVRQMYDFMKNTLEISTITESGPINDLAIAPLTLGSLSYGITSYELAGAYSIFGNGGTFNSLHAYEKVTDANGKTILEPERTSSQAISPETAFIMNKMLATVIDNTAPGAQGTGKYYKLDNNVPAIGKTGTTNDDRDRWFVGLTPEYVTAVWWGYDMKHTFWPSTGRLWKVGAANVPGNVWKDIMDDYYLNHEHGEFPEQPENVVERTYCIESGDIAGPNCGAKSRGYYNLDYEKDLVTCTYHSGEAPPPEG